MLDSDTLLHVAQILEAAVKSQVQAMNKQTDAINDLEGTLYALGEEVSRLKSAVVTVGTRL